MRYNIVVDCLAGQKAAISHNSEILYIQVNLQDVLSIVLTLLTLGDRSQHVLNVSKMSQESENWVLMQDIFQHAL